MPIYEYTCEACRRRVSLFFRSLGAIEDNPACPRCGERRLRRRMSRFWSRSSEPERDADGAPEDDVPGDTMAWDDEDTFAGDADEDFDPSEFAREARRMAALTGEPLDDEFETALRHIESGADPDDVFGEMDARAEDADAAEA